MAGRARPQGAQTPARGRAWRARRNESVVVLRAQRRDRIGSVGIARAALGRGLPHSSERGRRVCKPCGWRLLAGRGEGEQAGREERAAARKQGAPQISSRLHISGRPRFRRHRTSPKSLGAKKNRTCQRFIWHRFFFAYTQKKTRRMATRSAETRRMATRSAETRRMATRRMAVRHINGAQKRVGRPNRPQGRKRRHTVPEGKRSRPKGHLGRWVGAAMRQQAE